MRVKDCKSERDYDKSVYRIDQKLWKEHKWNCRKYLWIWFELRIIENTRFDLCKKKKKKKNGEDCVA